MGQPHGADLRRIVAIQKAGAEVARGRIGEVHRVEVADSKNRVMRGDVAVEVPLRSAGGGIVGSTRLEVVNGNLGRQEGLCGLTPGLRDSGTPGHAAAGAALPAVRARLMAVGAPTTCPSGPWTARSV